MDEPTRHLDPPRLARRLLQLILTERDRAAALSDLDEEFEDRCARQGRRAALRWYRAQVARSLWPSACRMVRSLRPLGLLAPGFSWLDVRVGFRLLRKHSALSLVSIAGLAVAVAIGAGYFAAFSVLLDPTLPLDEGDRLVSIQSVDTNTGEEEDRILRDFLVWRNALQSADVAAMQIESRNLIVGGETTRLVRVAKLTAAGFRVARVAPVLGRLLVEADERPGAAPVLVIAEEVWEELFDRHAGILGRSVQLGRTAHTIVGVMPAGFRFPLSNQFWVPLRLDREVHEPRTGPSIHVFGRLADGVTMEAAEAELSAMAARIGAASPGTSPHLRPHVLPYVYPFNGVDSVEVAWGIRVAQFAIGLLIVLVAVNVAMLVYARTAARAGEIAVRTALGASRRRVIAQLFAEALVLSSVAAALGLGLAGVALRITQNFLATSATASMPFWVELDLSAGTIAYVAGLAVIAGIIVGVAPGLQATGRRVQMRLQHLSSPAAHASLGRVWTGLIVGQVAAAVAVLPLALHLAGLSLLRGGGEPPYRAETILTASLTVEPDPEPPGSEAGAEISEMTGYRTRASELLRRVEAEPSFEAATFASRFPGHEDFWRFEIEPLERSVAAPGEELDAVTVATRVNRIDPEFFDVLGVKVLEGRGFLGSDSDDRSHPAIVDRQFADEVLGGVNVIGRRMRRILRVRRIGAEPAGIQAGPWLRVVGVVPDIAVRRYFDPGEDGRVYLPVAAAEAPVPLHLLVRLGSADPGAHGRLRDIAARLDPGLQLGQLRTAADVEREAARLLSHIAWAVAATALSVVLLSAAGVYAMTSFTVEQRRREIGIRAALGASPARLLGRIFARASAQLGSGVLVGLVLAAALDRVAGDQLGERSPLLLPAVAGLMVMVGMLAAIGPARRGLAVQPNAALREE